MYLSDLGKAKDVLKTQLSVFAMKLVGGGLANRYIKQMVKVSVGWGGSVINNLMNAVCCAGEYTLLSEILYSTTLGPY